MVRTKAMPQRFNQERLLERIRNLERDLRFETGRRRNAEAEARANQADRVQNLRLLQRVGMLTYTNNGLNIRIEKLQSMLISAEKREGPAPDCTICGINKANFIQRPCGHRTCGNCADQWRVSCPRKPLSCNGCFTTLELIIRAYPE